jgi:hypothetical protein
MTDKEQPPAVVVQAQAASAAGGVTAPEDQENED